MDVPCACRNRVGEQVAQEDPQRHRRQRNLLRQVGGDLGRDRAKVAQRLIQAVGYRRASLGGRLGVRRLQQHVDQLQRPLHPHRGVVLEACQLERRLQLVGHQCREVSQRLVAPCQLHRLLRQPLIGPPAPQHRREAAHGRSELRAMVTADHDHDTGRSDGNGDPPAATLPVGHL